MNRTRIVSFITATALVAALAVAAPASAVAANMALGKTATASSVEHPDQGAAKAIDGDSTTRWGSIFADNQWLTVDLGGRYMIENVVLRWEAAYAKAYQIRVSYDGINWTTVYSTADGKGGTETLAINRETSRYVQMYGITRATAYGFSVREFAIYAWSNTMCRRGTGLGSTATASSMEHSGSAPGRAIDDDRSTRWTSKWTDHQWLRVDMGQSEMVCRISLVWEAAYGKSYQIRVSEDGLAWQTVFSKTNGTGGTELITLSAPVQGRYVEMEGFMRGTPWGYSLWEFKVNPLVGS